MTGSSPGSDLKVTKAPAGDLFAPLRQGAPAQTLPDVQKGNKDRILRTYLKASTPESTCALILSIRAFIRKTRRVMHTSKPVFTLALSFPYVVHVLSYFEVQE